MTRESTLDSLTFRAAVLSAVLAAVILVVHALTHVPFFDEALRVHYLWLLSTGLESNVDFFAPHPMAGFLAMLPLMRFLPESPSAILPLRIVSILLASGIGALFALHSRRVANDWIPGLLSFLLVVTAPALGVYHSEYSVDHLSALAAFGAIYLFFSDPAPRNVAVAAALSVVSVAIMPKYPLPLIFGLSGYMACCCREKRRMSRVLVAAALGIALGGVAVLLLFHWGGESVARNIRYSFLLQFRYAVLEGRFLSGAPAFDPTLFYAGAFMLENPVAGIAMVLGISGWLAFAWRSRSRLVLGGVGVLCGVMASALVTKSFKEEYLSPVLLCLAFFLPFAFVSLSFSPEVKRAARLLLAVGALVTLVAESGTVLREFGETPLNVRGATPTHLRLAGDIGVVRVPSWPRFAAKYERLLELVPRNERVVAVWPIHPMFRRDATFITFDEIPSHSVALPEGDPLKRAFDPDLFKATLEAAPPALIALSWLEANYPPGWSRVAEKFLSSHEGVYSLLKEEFSPGMGPVYIRKDLVNR